MAVTLGVGGGQSVRPSEHGRLPRGSSRGRGVGDPGFSEDLAKRLEAERRLAEQRAIAERERKRLEERARQKERIKIQLETQKKISRIRKSIRDKQRGKSNRDRIRLQNQQRRMIENILKSQAERQVREGIVNKVSVSTIDGRIDFSRGEKLSSIITKEFPKKGGKSITVTTRTIPSKKIRFTKKPSKTPTIKKKDFKRITKGIAREIGFGETGDRLLIATLSKLSKIKPKTSIESLIVKQAREKFIKSITNEVSPKTPEERKRLEEKLKKVIGLVGLKLKELEDSTKPITIKQARAKFIKGITNEVKSKTIADRKRLEFQLKKIFKFRPKPSREALILRKTKTEFLEKITRKITPQTIKSRKRLEKDLKKSIALTKPITIKQARAKFIKGITRKVSPKNIADRKRLEGKLSTLLKKISKIKPKTSKESIKIESARMEFLKKITKEQKPKTIEDRKRLEKKISKQLSKIPTIKKEDLKKISKEFAFGELGEKFIGVSLPRPIGITQARPDITARKAKTFLRKRGLTGKVVGEFIPTTPAEVALFGGVGALGAGAGGKFLQVATSGTLATLGTKTAITKDLPAETRIAGGLVVLGSLIPATALLKSKKTFIKTTQPKIPKGKTKTPLSKTFQREAKFEINNPAVRSFIRARLKKGGIDFNKLSKIERNFIEGQVKARIRNRPELFIPKTRQVALKRVKIRTQKQLRDFVRKRLKGEFDKPIEFTSKQVGAKKQLVPKLSATQKLALKRFSNKAQGDRLRKVVLKRLDKKTQSKLDLLSKADKEFIIGQIKARIRADPKLRLTKTQRIALSKIKRVSELERIKGLTSRRLKGEFDKPIKLSETQKQTIRSKVKTLIKSQPKRFIPKERKLALDRFAKLQEKRAIKRAVKKGSRDLKPSDLISKADKKFIAGQIKARVRSQPEVLIPGARQVALQQVRQKVQVKKIPVIEIKTSGLTEIQKLALKRQKQSLAKINKAKQIGRKIDIPVQEKVTIRRIQRFRRGQRQVQKLLQKEKQKVTQQRQFLKQKAIAKQNEFSALQTKVQVAIKQKSKIKSISLLRQKNKQILQLEQKSKQVQKQFQGLKILEGNAQKMEQGINLAFKQKQKVKTIPIKKQELIRKKKRKGFIRLRSTLRKREVQKSQQVFNVFGKVKGKFIKINPKPLVKGDALSKGAFAVDNTTAKTFKITPAGKTKKPGRLLKNERNYFNRQGFKLREVRIKKGRKFKLKQKYIEKRRFGIDTRGEKKGLTIRRLIKQQQKAKRKITPTQRKVLIKRLKKARRIKKLKGGKR